MGGRLLTVNLSRDGEGRYLGHNGGETRNVHDQLHQIWRGMADEGLISEEQYRKGTVLNFYKSPEEFMAPLKDTASAPYRNGLRLIDERTVYVKCPYRRRWNEDALASQRLPGSKENNTRKCGARRIGHRRVLRR